eukprot:TRINITY_DN3634_c0_g1_i2.p1 TRINITY_DN3634_c0_g1~~TRINITY_DN3634_c0_g1_i2.p1  ORF type:complete len:141 (+),score=6.95 TRINITY_DN3634_c0_g1_i2:510-932(+)
MGDKRAILFHPASLFYMAIRHILFASVFFFSFEIYQSSMEPFVSIFSFGVSLQNPRPKCSSRHQKNMRALLLFFPKLFHDFFFYSLVAAVFVFSLFLFATHSPLYLYGKPSHKLKIVQSPSQREIHQIRNTPSSLLFRHQ